MLNLLKFEFSKMIRGTYSFVIILSIIFIILTFNIYVKYKNNLISYSPLDAYKTNYNTDSTLLSMYNQFVSLGYNESFDNLTQRYLLEKYALDNNINYNIMNDINSNYVQPIPYDARYLLIQSFRYYSPLMCLLSSFIFCVLFTKELSDNTIKILLVRSSRIKILLSKIIVSVLLCLLLQMFIVICQFFIGGMLFGFDSYQLNYIFYNSSAQEVNSFNFFAFILISIFGKIPLFLGLCIFSFLLGVFFQNETFSLIGSFFIAILSISNVSISEFSTLDFLLLSDWDLSIFINNFCNHAFFFSLFKIVLTLAIMFLLLSFKFSTISIKNKY